MSHGAGVLTEGALTFNGYDCETCGWNAETVEWEASGHGVTLRASVGCYSSLYEHDADLRAVQAFIGHLKQGLPKSKRKALTAFGEEIETYLASLA